MSFTSAMVLAANDWPQFRGHNSDGIGSGSPPVAFGPGVNQRWKTTIAPGHSSPCFFGNKIFLTAYDEQTPSVSIICLDKNTGGQIWQKTIPVEALEKGHPSFNPASSSPCCDDQYVVAYFGSYGLICLDHEGKQLWDLKLPLAKSFGGNAASPIIAGDRVVLYRGSYSDHFLLCLNKQTGKEEWRIEQTEKFTGEMACTACPIIAGDQLICHSARCVQSFDIETGRRNWIAQCATTATSTPLIVDQEVIVAAWNKLGEPDLRPPFPRFDELIAEHDQNENGSIERSEFPKLWIFHRPEGIEAAMNGAPISWRHANPNGDSKIEEDEWTKIITGLERYRAGAETHGLIAIPLDSEGFVPTEKVRKLVIDGIPEVPSPVSDGKYVYLVKNGGLLTCIDVTSGERVCRMRTRGRGTHYASPLVADGRLYTFAGDGRISVIDIQDSPEILAVNEMQDSVYATPAIMDGVLYVRTHSALFAFQEQSN
ncbi:MAG: PQQ-binding-like beta-propeller repeat protein [Planctomycetota bacterium]